MILQPQNLESWQGNLNPSCLHDWSVSSDQDGTCQCSKCGGSISQADALNMILKALQGL